MDSKHYFFFLARQCMVICIFKRVLMDFWILSETTDRFRISAIFFTCTSSVCVPPFKWGIAISLSYSYFCKLWKKNLALAFQEQFPSLMQKRKLRIASSCPWGEKPWTEHSFSCISIGKVQMVLLGHHKPFHIRELHFMTPQPRPLIPFIHF